MKYQCTVTGVIMVSLSLASTQSPESRRMTDVRGVSTHVIVTGEGERGETVSTIWPPLQMKEPCSGDVLRHLPSGRLD